MNSETEIASLPWPEGPFIFLDITTGPVRAGRADLPVRPVSAPHFSDSARNWINQLTTELHSEFAALQLPVTTCEIFGRPQAGAGLLITAPSEIDNVLRVLRYTLDRFGLLNSATIHYADPHSDLLRPVLISALWGGPRENYRLATAFMRTLLAVIQSTGELAAQERQARDLNSKLLSICADLIARPAAAAELEQRIAALEKLTPPPAPPSDPAP